MRGKSVVTKSVREFADEVRIAGDDAAHPEELGTVTREDAEVVGAHQGRSDNCHDQPTETIVVVDHA